MLTKKISLLAAMLIAYTSSTFIMCETATSNVSFGDKNDKVEDGGFPGETKDTRYDHINGCFDSEKNQFIDGYSRRRNDLDVVKEHKELVEKRIAEYQSSWMPLLLKIVGTGFGINAGLSALDSVFVATNNAKKATHKYAYADYSPLRAIDHVLDKLMMPIRYPWEKILLKAYKEKFIGNTGFDLGWAVYIGSQSLLAASIATWLFNKANSYQEAIARLKTEIAIDTQMIQALEKLPIQSSR